MEIGDVVALPMDLVTRGFRFDCGCYKVKFLTTGDTILLPEALLIDLNIAPFASMGHWTSDLNIMQDPRAAEMNGTVIDSYLIQGRVIKLLVVQKMSYTKSLNLPLIIKREIECYTNKMRKDLKNMKQKRKSRSRRQKNKQHVTVLEVIAFIATEQSGVIWSFKADNLEVIESKNKK